MYYLAVAIFLSPLVVMLILYFLRRRLRRAAEESGLAGMPIIHGEDDSRLEASEFAGRAKDPEPDLDGGLLQQTMARLRQAIWFGGPHS
jgi:hypothetical protein